MTRAIAESNRLSPRVLSYGAELPYGQWSSVGLCSTYTTSEFILATS